MPLNILIIKLMTTKMNNFSFGGDNPQTSDLEPGREKIWLVLLFKFILEH